MPIDTLGKRMAAAGVPFLPLGVNVEPGSLATTLGRAATAWSYLVVAVPPTPGTSRRDTITLGTKESLAVTPDPTLGGWQSW